MRVLAQSLIKREYFVGSAQSDTVDVLGGIGVVRLILLLIFLLVLDCDDAVDGLVRANSVATLLVLLIVYKLHLVLLLLS